MRKIYKKQLKELRDFIDNDMQKVIENQRKAIRELEKIQNGTKKGK